MASRISKSQVAIPRDLWASPVITESPAAELVRRCVEDVLAATGMDWITSDRLNVVRKIVEASADVAPGKSQEVRRVAVARIFAYLADNGFYSDPSHVRGVWEHAGTLVLNPFRGCNFGCVYCFRAPESAGASDWFLNGRPVRVHDDRDLVESLLEHRHFVPDETIIGVHCATTDPFLPQVRDSTHELIGMIDTAGYANPVLVIAKMPPSDRDLARLAELKNVKVLLFLTYNGASAEMETLSGSAQIDQRRWAVLDRLTDLPDWIRVAHYYRPIVLGWNDRDEQIDRSLRYGQRVGISVIGGLKPIDGLSEYATARGLPVVTQFDQGGKRGKIFPDELRRRILGRHEALRLDSLIVGDQSCAITVLLNRIDRRIRPNIEAVARYDEIREPGSPARCMSRCSTAQLEACRNAEPAPVALVADLLGYLGHAGTKVGVAAGAVRVTGPAVPDEDLEFLVSRTRYPIVRGV